MSTARRRLAPGCGWHAFGLSTALRSTRVGRGTPPSKDHGTLRRPSACPPAWCPTSEQVIVAANTKGGRAQGPQAEGMYLRPQARHGQIKTNHFTRGPLSCPSVPHTSGQVAVAADTRGGAPGLGSRQEGRSSRGRASQASAAQRWEGGGGRVHLVSGPGPGSRGQEWSFG